MSLDQLITHTRLRVRWLRALRFSSWGLLGGMFFSLIYLGLVAFGVFPDHLVAWLVGFNGGIALLGAVVGAAMTVNTPRVLYTLDRSLNTGEVLVTLHDLGKRARKHDFFPILEHQYRALNVRPQRVFRLNVRDAQRGGGIVALLLLNLILVGFGPDLASLTGLPLGNAQDRKQARATRTLEDRLLAEELRAQFEDIRKELGDLGLQQPNEDGLGSQDENPAESLIQLYQNLNRAQSQVLGLTSSLQPSPNQASPPSEQMRQQQREQMARIQQLLQQILEQLRQGQSGEESPPTLQDLQASVDQLPEDDPLRQQLEQALGQNRADLQQQALQRAQDELGQRLDADQNLESLRRQLEERLGNAPERGESPSAAGRQDTGQSDPNASETGNVPGEQPGARNPSSGQTQAGSPSSGPTQQDQAQGDSSQALEGSSEGSEPGVGTQEGTPREVPLDWNPAYKEADIPPNMVAAESLEEWLSRGVPVESTQQPGQPTRFRLSYDQVEALLDVRDLSPELRDVVRLYFLQIIGQLNQAAPQTP